MATEHKFGGSWTDAKLDCLKNYLLSYRKIFAKNEKAKYFKTWYVDAFAGTGERTAKFDKSPSADLFDDFYELEEAVKYREGSVNIALSLDSPFDRYLFIEKSPSHAAQLREFLKQKHGELIDRVTCSEGDANDVLGAWISARDWTKERAVVFLDPYGLQVEWKTIQLLGNTKGIDLWYLFPLGLGPMRMIPRDGDIPPAWSEKLDRLFGTHEWKDEFFKFKPSPQGLLFGESNGMQRDISPEIVSAFVKGRLQSCFYAVADGMVLRNSKHSPMYLLCFAASNERGAGPALRIAKSILGK